MLFVTVMNSPEVSAITGHLFFIPEGYKNKATQVVKSDASLNSSWKVNSSEKIESVKIHY